MLGLRSGGAKGGALQGSVDGKRLSIAPGVVFASMMSFDNEDVHGLLESMTMQLCFF